MLAQDLELGVRDAQNEDESAEGFGHSDTESESTQDQSIEREQKPKFGQCVTWPYIPPENLGLSKPSRGSSWKIPL